MESLNDLIWKAEDDLDLQALGDKPTGNDMKPACMEIISCIVQIPAGCTGLSLTKEGCY